MLTSENLDEIIVTTSEADLLGNVTIIPRIEIVLGVCRIEIACLSVGEP